MMPAEIARPLGLKRGARSFRGNCPSCGYPGAFAVKSDKHGTARLFCSNHCTAADLQSAVARVIGGEAALPAVQTRDDPEKRARMIESARRCWTGSTALTGTLAEAYLLSRLLEHLVTSPALRFRGDTSHPEGGKLPALNAEVVDVAGAFIGIHRTYLAAPGRKANVTPAKASLGPIWGGAIRLQSFDPGKPLVVGEGIETAASLGLLTGNPAWAAISAGNMAKGLILPDAVRDVLIAVDPDPPGERAAEDAARRWQREGRRVRLARPDGDGDFNEVLRAGGHIDA